MSKVFVFAEHKNGFLKRGSMELLQAAQRSGNAVVGMVVGTGADKVAIELGHHGAQEVHVVKDASLDTYNPELYMAALSLVLEKVQPQVLLASATSTAKDLFP
ncbi:MAG: electron transfer flavoprotein subunit alpha/FixB family protein, partial [Pseudobdellovibrionaceae bacterium]